jgi:hypothetical protein
VTYSMESECAHCGVVITDPSTRVIHGDAAFCCTNCAQAMEQGGSGSDRRTLAHENDLRCAHCGVPIVDESTMASAGNDAYCCFNCAGAGSASSASTGTANRTRTT